jgi:hypothetical protein
MESLSLIQGKYHKSRNFQTEYPKEAFTNIRNTVANNTTNPNITLSTSSDNSSCIATSTPTSTSSPLESNQVSTDPDTQEAFDLQAKMEDLLSRLQQAQSDQASFTDKFVNSTNTSTNKYLNNNVRFLDVDRYGYVTNLSELKMYVNNNDNYIYKENKGKHGCPDNEPIEISIPFPSQPKLGQSIELEPGIFVVLGLPITKVGESCGFEGRNVYVDKLITNTTATYQGCYADNNNGSWTTMSFIGGAPPKGAHIDNGNFEQHPVVETYKYIGDSSELPGWSVDAVLINWTEQNQMGFLKPPNGNYFICLQGLGSISKIIHLDAGTYTLSWSSIGWTAHIANEIKVFCNDNTTPINITTSTPISTYTPPIDSWTNYSASIIITNSGNYNIGFFGTNQTDPNNTASGIQNIILTNNSFSSSGTYTYDSCKQKAMNNGYQYFALQDVDKEKKTGYCAVANNSMMPTWFGESKIPESTTAIWSSKTNINTNISGSGGKYAKLTGIGSLAVYNADDAVIFTTTIPEDQTTGYIGCYTDSSSRAMNNISNNKYIEFEDCRQLAIDNNLKYFALQDVKPVKDSNGNEVGIGWCAGSDHLGQSIKYGKAGNCGSMSNTDKRIGGRGWSNAIYSTSPDSPHYLILQDDGNMCIYKGNRIFNQGFVWGSKQDTENIIGEYKIQDPNPTKTAAKGKYKQNYITNDDEQILEVGDFIGSQDGSTFLIMQDDGNLVLYTTKLVTNCPILDSINYQDIYGGGIGANALYKLDEVAFPGNMGKFGYVNGGSRISEYPADMIPFSYSELKQNTLSKSIQIISGYNWTDGTIDDAKTACDNESACNQILTNTSMPGKYLIATGSNADLYNVTGYNSILKTKTLDTTKINSSCNSQDPIPIDTIQWEHYLKGLPMTPETTCSITKLETLQNKTIDDLKIQLADVSSQLVEKLNKIEVKNNSMNSQMDAGGQQIRIDVKKYKENAQKILSYSKMPNKKRQKIMPQNNTNTNTNNLEGYENAFIDNIVADSNIVSTQGIYSYIIWSVIATVTVIITIELFTNERNTPLWKLVFLSVIIVIINGLFREYALLVNILIVIMFVIKKKFKLMAKENNNV